MFNSDILDLVVTLCFVYFLLALLCSTINEIINAIRGVRNKYLKEAIEKLFFDDSWKEIYPKLMNSPFIESLQSEKKCFPSYIPSKNFAQAIVDVMQSDKTLSLSNTNLYNLVSNNSTIKGDLKNTLLILINEAQNDYNKFIEGLEKYFDNVMDRVNGWFKRNNRKVLMTICFIVTIAVNVDTVNISTVLWKDKNALKQASEISVELSKEYNRENIIIADKQQKDSLSFLYKQIIAGKDSTKNIVAKLSTLPIPIGWDKQNFPPVNSEYFTEWLVKFGGWFITAFALFLGAPFWFDTLNKFVNVRATGKKPQSQNDDKDKT